MICSEGAIRLNWYKILVNGENFLVDADGESTQMGFFVTRDVQAESEISARECALNLVAREMMFRLGKTDLGGTNSTLTVEEVDEIDPSKIDDPLQGYSFYPMN